MILETIDRLFAELNALKPLTKDQQKALDEKFRLEFNFNSNHLEGNTLTYGETKLLLIFDETKGSHSLREYEEMKAHDVAFELIKEWALDKERPLTEQSIKNLNEILLVRPFWKEAVTEDGQATRRLINIGNYKEHSNSVRLTNGEIFEYTSPIDTPIKMLELMQWYNEEKGQIHPVTLAAMFHYKFVRIHPFDDGNGRIARLLMNYILLTNDYSPVIIPTVDKINYLRALHLADAGDYEPFINYIGEQVVWSLEISLKAAKGENIDEPEDWKKKVSLLESKYSSIESVKIVKSQLDFRKFLNQNIFPFLIELKENIVEFDNLFLQKKYIVPTDDHWHEIDLSDLEEVNKYSTKNNTLKINFIFSDLNKFKEKTFNISIPINFIFEELYFYLKIDSEIFLKKLYHEKLSIDDLNNASNRIGSLAMKLIEKNINLIESQSKHK